MKCKLQSAEVEIIYKNNYVIFCEAKHFNKFQHNVKSLMHIRNLYLLPKIIKIAKDKFPLKFYKTLHILILLKF